MTKQSDIIVLTEQELRRVKQEAYDKMAAYAKHIAKLYAEGHGSLWYSTPGFNQVAAAVAKQIAFDLSLYEGEEFT